MRETTKDTAGRRLGTWCRDNTSALLLLALIAAGAIMSDNFLAWSNLMNLLRRITVNGIMAIGFTMTLLVGGFDLSIGSTLSLCAVLCVGFENDYGSAGLAMLVALGAGLAMGLLNGILMKVTRGGSGEAFLITLATSLVANSLATYYCDGMDLYGVHAGWYKAIGQGSLAGIPICAILWLILLAVFQLLIKKTVFGRSLLLTGANKKSAFLSGVSVGAMKIVAFALAGVMAALAAIVLTARTTGASPNSGSGGDFDAAIASIIGGNALVGGQGGMVQVLVGTIIYGLITNILNLIGVESVVQYIVKGCILLLAICLDNLKKR